MIEITQERLLALNHLGLIPGPEETAEAFAKRADYCLHLKSHLSQEIKATFEGEHSADPEVLEPARTQLLSFYDMSPDWIPLFFSDYRLPFWQGGCAWIFQTEEDSPTAALIQLRQSFRHKDCYLGIYHRDELLAHELVHVGRMAFQEPHFEEILAYRTATSSFRRWLGPLVQSSIESVVFILILGLIIVCDFFLIALDRMDAYLIAIWLKLIPLVLIIYALYRLGRRQIRLKKCLTSLQACLGSEEKALAVCYRLTDEEIYAFAQMSSEEIKAYGDSQSAKELRWRVIRSAYFCLNGT